MSLPALIDTANMALSVASNPLVQSAASALGSYASSFKDAFKADIARQVRFKRLGGIEGYNDWVNRTRYTRPSSTPVVPSFSFSPGASMPFYRRRYASRRRRYARRKRLFTSPPGTRPRTYQGGFRITEPGYRAIGQRRIKVRDSPNSTVNPDHIIFVRSTSCSVYEMVGNIDLGNNVNQRASQMIRIQGYQCKARLHWASPAPDQTLSENRDYVVAFRWIIVYDRDWHSATTTVSTPNRYLGVDIAELDASKQAAAFYRAQSTIPVGWTILYDKMYEYKVNYPFLETYHNFPPINLRLNHRAIFADGQVSPISGAIVSMIIPCSKPIYPTAGDFEYYPELRLRQRLMWTEY